jgi:predicted XRE-type DNA-binding protein
MSYTRSKRKPKRRKGAISRSAGSVTGRSKANAKRAHESEEIEIIHGSDNVFEDLGFNKEEAANLKIRAKLMLYLRDYIQKERGWTQVQAAAFFGETQPRISNLLKGEIGRFSVDKLINMLARAGKRVEVSTESEAA